jgi:RimJ/RimL family protein N-acetyltransferase
MKQLPSTTIDELSSMNKQQVYEHLLRLSPDDRYTRFCTTATDAFIRRYVFEVMDLDTSPSYGAFANGKLVGFAHIAVIDLERCELAFSIDEDHRGSGLVRNLMRTAIAWCREHGMQKLCMSCLRQNKKMQALATSFGLNMTITYDEAYAELGIVQ